MQPPGRIRAGQGDAGDGVLVNVFYTYTCYSTTTGTDEVQLQSTPLTSSRDARESFRVLAQCRVSSVTDTVVSMGLGPACGVRLFIQKWAFYFFHIFRSFYLSRGRACDTALSGCVSGDRDVPHSSVPP